MGKAKAQPFFKNIRSANGIVIIEIRLLLGSVFRYPLCTFCFLSFFLCITLHIYPGRRDHQKNALGSRNNAGVTKICVETRNLFFFINGGVFPRFGDSCYKLYCGGNFLYLLTR
jgi:hypothetical protein